LANNELTSRRIQRLAAAAAAAVSDAVVWMTDHRVSSQTRRSFHKSLYTTSLCARLRLPVPFGDGFLCSLAAKETVSAEHVSTVRILLANSETVQK